VLPFGQGVADACLAAVARWLVVCYYGGLDHGLGRQRIAEPGSLVSQHPDQYCQPLQSMADKQPFQSLKAHVAHLCYACHRMRQSALSAE